MPPPAIAPAQTTAPFFGGLLDTIWAFVLAWMGKYWWFVVILVILYYTRWYQVARQTQGGVTAATPFLALRASATSIADEATKTAFHLSGAIMFALGTGVWMLQSFGELAFGTIGFEPVIIGQVAAFLISIGAAIGVNLSLRHAIGAFLIAAALAWFIGEANRYAEQFED